MRAESRALARRRAPARMRLGRRSSATYRRSLVDLAALRFSPPIAGGRSLPAAGLPWFMTMFGRDSIFTSLQALPFTPELAATTLRALGDWQGTRIDDFRDEDPGRILHEMRYGEMTAFEERPHSPYYGGADATPLYVVLLDEYERWTGDTKLVRELEHEARAALELDRRVRRPAGQRLHLVPAPQREDRPREPVLEGLLGLDLLPRRHAARASRGRPASCRATPTTPRCAAPGWPARSGRTRASPTGSRRRPPTSSAASTATSGSTTASTSRSRSTPTANQVDALTSNNGHLLWSGIVDKSKAEGRRAAPDGTAAVLRLGRAHAGRGRGPLQPDRLPRRHGLAVRQLVHRLGPAPLRLQGGGGADRGRHPRRGRVLRRPAARGVRRLRARR